MSALSTKENQFLKLARMHPEGLTDSIIETELPHFELDDVVNVANSLSSKSLIQLMRQGTGIVYKAKTDDEAKK
ncbi:hypothetical protein IWQ62_000648 [Dispira parvispora]|uniref:Uncharacterized protein n=1 Tax=Dispira parvispora TaxID=1520584 RepID=A0A9W8AVG3_9FUNG|nr:hypothetical protein IWQ62_000648 [Dispira parvispora]